MIVGDAPYASDYKAQVKAAAAATPGAILAGYVFGDGYAELQSNALLYVQATEVGGTHPALVEAMGRGAAILANDVPEHHEVLADAGIYYERNDADALAREQFEPWLMIRTNGRGSAPLRRNARASGSRGTT